MFTKMKCSWRSMQVGYIIITYSELHLLFAFTTDIVIIWNINVKIKCIGNSIDSNRYFNISWILNYLNILYQQR